ncbi:MAG: tyrosine-type recombinase/integrase [Isosphaeraceae bacterium]
MTTRFARPEAGSACGRRPPDCERKSEDRKTPWRLVKRYCEVAGIDPSRLGSRGIGIHSLRKTAINDAIRNGATMHEVREFAGHADIRTTELYFVRKEEDARRIQIRVTGRRLSEPGAWIGSRPDARLCAVAALSASRLAVGSRVIPGPRGDERFCGRCPRGKPGRTRPARAR